MNCVNCYHYQACAGVDVTGYVTDREKVSEHEVCEHFLNPEDVRPKAHWVRRVRPFISSKDVIVYYVCSRCGCEHERVYTKDIIAKTLWDEYLNDHWMPKNDMHPFCHNCGSEMELDKTDHTNVMA